jgi:hypothetical protein
VARSSPDTVVTLVLALLVTGAQTRILEENFVATLYCVEIRASTSVGDKYGISRRNPMPNIEQLFDSFCVLMTQYDSDRVTPHREKCNKMTESAILIFRLSTIKQQLLERSWRLHAQSDE